jgi:hypothetical protein
VPVLGTEPAANVAEAARGRDVRRYGSLRHTLAEQLVAEGARRFIIGNNVLAWRRTNDFVAGMAAALAPEGVIASCGGAPGLGAEKPCPDRITILHFSAGDTLLG